MAPVMAVTGADIARDALALTARLVVHLAELVVLALHQPGDTRADVAASLRRTMLTAAGLS